jgi:DNA-binding CsgD family transcriptional regulator
MKNSFDYLNATFTSEISDSTTLAELLASLGETHRLDKTPALKNLREKSSVITATKSCTIFANGYAVYENETGRTVMFLADCKSFTYYFDPLTEREKSYQRQSAKIDDLSNLPWVIAVTIRGDHQIEQNSMNRTGSRKGTIVTEEEEKTDFDNHGPYHYPNPEDEYIRKETLQRNIRKLTSRQKKTWALAGIYGYSQEEIAQMLHISPAAVKYQIEHIAAKNGSRYMNIC